jgi:hypothetical protein
MRQDFVTRLEHELIAAAERQAGTAPRRVRRPVALRRLVPALAVAAALVAAAVLIASAYRHAETSLPSKPPPPQLVAHEQLASKGGPAVAGLGAVWVSDPGSGDVLRVDPGSRKIVTRVPVGDGAWLVAGDDALWALTPGRLQEIDPDRNRVVRRIPVPARAASAFMAGGAMWLGAPDGLARVDLRSGAVGRTISLADDGFHAVGGNTDGKMLYVLRADGTLLRIDGRSGRRSKSIAAAASGPIDAVAGSTLFVAQDDAEVALDGRTGRELWRRPLGSRSVNNATVDGSTLWVHATDRATNRDRLWRLDARTGAVAGALTLPAFGAAGMTTVGGRPWVISLEGELMEAR